MSRYLIAHRGDARISCCTRTEIEASRVTSHLEHVRLARPGQRAETPCHGLFVFIGAAPNTAGCATRAPRRQGFVLTGPRPPATPLPGGPRRSVLETSRSGIFCVGDARLGSMKRVAAAMGEGSMAVRLVFERLFAGGRT